MAGVAVALRREGDTLADLRVAITGTNPRPVLLEGTQELCGGPLDERVLEGLDDLVRDQIMSMKTTFTPGHYRRRVAGVLARRLVRAAVRARAEAATSADGAPLRASGQLQHAITDHNPKRARAIRQASSPGSQARQTSGRIS